jgi:hypothetical protein
METTAPKTMKGDCGKMRQEFAKKLGTFKQTKTTATEFGSSVTPNEASESDYKPFPGKEIR